MLNDTIKETEKYLGKLIQELDAERKKEMTKKIIKIKNEEKEKLEKIKTNALDSINNIDEDDVLINLTSLIEFHDDYLYENVESILIDFADTTDVKYLSKDDKEEIKEAIIDKVKEVMESYENFLEDFLGELENSVGKKNVINEKNRIKALLNNPKGTFEIISKEKVKELYDLIVKITEKQIDFEFNFGKRSESKKEIINMAYEVTLFFGFNATNMEEIAESRLKTSCKKDKVILNELKNKIKIAFNKSDYKKNLKPKEFSDIKKNSNYIYLLDEEEKKKILRKEILKINKKIKEIKDSDKSTEVKVYSIQGCKEKLKELKKYED